MTDKEFNSRAVYLGGFILIAAVTLIHCVTYVHSGVKDPSYPTILTVLLGGHIGNGLHRYLTKKDGTDGKDGADTDEAKGA